ncbi:30S ribosomal protein S8 [bacterium]|nr:30S ribosomal protein S8 [bacterium]MBU3955450.1 30S ribosomal protein S8 [bacterium]
MSQDPIADFLAAFKNGLMRNKPYIDFPASKILGDILKIMENRGFLVNFKKITDNNQGFFRIFPKYEGKKPVLRGAERVSKPSGRKYASVKDIPVVFEGYGICIMSTPRGLMDGDAAKSANCGGEVICRLW